MNIEGYRDPTAEEAVGRVAKEAKRAAEASDDKITVVSWLAKTFKQIASLTGLEITNRIEFRDKETKKEYK